MLLDIFCSFHRNQVTDHTSRCDNVASERVGPWCSTRACARSPRRCDRSLKSSSSLGTPVGTWWCLWTSTISSIRIMTNLWRTGMLMWVRGVPGLARQPTLRCVVVTEVESPVASYTRCWTLVTLLLTLGLINHHHMLPKVDHHEHHDHHNYHCHKNHTWRQVLQHLNYFSHQKSPLILIKIIILVAQLPNQFNHDHHTCCQVPSHVSDAGPGARVVAALKSGQLFAFRQPVNNHEDGSDDDGNYDDDGSDDDDDEMMSFIQTN